jgi:hypothetical protein
LSVKCVHRITDKTRGMQQTSFAWPAQELPNLGYNVTHVSASNA